MANLSDAIGTVTVQMPDGYTVDQLKKLVNIIFSHSKEWEYCVYIKKNVLSDETRYEKFSMKELTGESGVRFEADFAGTGRNSFEENIRNFLPWLAKNVYSPLEMEEEDFIQSLPFEITFLFTDVEKECRQFLKGTGYINHKAEVPLNLCHGDIDEVSEIKWNKNEINSIFGYEEA